MKHVIEGFQLLEADGGGVRDIEVAIVASEADAKLWVGGSRGYRRYTPIKKTIIVHESLASLEAFNKSKVVHAALAKLSAAERVALGYPEKLEALEA